METNESLSVPGRKQVDFEGSDFVNEFVCDPCQEEGHQYVAFGFCSNCNHYLCKTCYTVHCRSLPTRNHSLLDKDRMPKNRPRLSTGNHDIDEKCEKHSRKIVEYFCKNHDAIGCSVCITLDHKLCDGVQFVPAIMVDKDKACMVMQELSSLNGNAKDKQERLNQWLALSEQSLDNAVQDARTFSIEMKSSIEILEKKFEKTAQSHRDTTVNFKGLEIDNLKKVIQQTESLRKDMSCYQSGDKNARLFIAMKKAEQMIASNSHVNDNDVLDFNYTFQPNEVLANLQDSIKTLGEVHVVCKTNESEDNASKLSRVNVKTSVEQFAAHSKDDTSDCLIVGVVSIGDPLRNIVADAGNNQIKVIKGYSDVLTTSLKIPSRPFAMAEFSDNKVCVTMPEKEKIIVVSISKFMFTKDTIRVAKSIQCGGKCYGIAIDEIAEEIMIVCEYEKDQFAIDILNFDGKTLRHFKCEEDTDIPRYIEVKNSHIYTLDSINGVLKKRSRLNGMVENKCMAGQALYFALTKNYLIVVTRSPQKLRVFDHDFHDLNAEGELCDKGDTIVCVGNDYGDSLFIAFSAGYVQEYKLCK